MTKKTYIVAARVAYRKVRPVWSPAFRARGSSMGRADLIAVSAIGRRPHFIFIAA